MATKINRNDPCPCGSRKKYKKCCGLKETVSITSILEGELVKLQRDIMDFTVDEYGMEIDEHFDEMFGDVFDENEQDLEFYVLTHTLWFTLFVPFEDGETPLQKYIKENSRYIQRARIKEILASWTEARPVAGKLLSYSPNLVELEDTLTGDQIRIKILDDTEEPESKFIFGIIVPFGEEYVFFPDFLDFADGTDTEKVELHFKQTFDESDYEDPTKFLKEEFLQVMFQLQFSTVNFSPEAMDWQEPMHENIAMFFEAEMDRMDAPQPFIDAGILLWHTFCSRKSKRIKKPELYVAALEYLLFTVNPYIQYTVRETATRYGLSESSLKKLVSEMKEVLAYELEELENAMLEGYSEGSGN